MNPHGVRVQEPKSQKQKSSWWALLGMALVSFLGCIDLTIVNTALPAIQKDLSASVTQLQWVMNICLLALTGFMVISGKLGDLYGRRLYLYVGMVLFGFSSLGAGFSQNIEWLIFFRFIQGVGIALLYTIPVAIIPSLFPKHEHGKAMGLLIAGNGLGLALGPVLGGFLVSTASWHWIFFINIPILVISFMFCFKHLSESKSEPENKTIDWTGFVLLATTVPAFVLAIVQGEFWGWFSAPILGLFGFSLLGFFALYFVEKKLKSPIIKFDLFSSRIFIVGLLANFSLAFFYAIDFFLIPLYLDEIHGQSALHIGLSLLPATAMMALLPPLTGKWVDARGPKSVLLLGCAFLAFSALLQIGFREAECFYFMLFAYTLFGMGFACILGPSIVAAMSSVPKAFSGVAIGTIGTVHNFGGAVGLAIGTAVYSWYAPTTLHLTSVQPQVMPSFLSGYSHALGVLVVLSVVTFVVTLCGLKKGK